MFIIIHDFCVNKIIISFFFFLQMPGKSSAFNVLDNLLAKQIIVSDLDRLVSYLRNNNTTGTGGEVPVDKQTSGETPDNNITDTSKDSTASPTASAASSPSSNKQPSITPVDLHTLLTPASISPKVPTPKVYRVPAANQKTPSHPINQEFTAETSTKATSTTTTTTTTSATTTVDPDVASGLDQLHQYVQVSEYNMRHQFNLNVHLLSVCP